MSRPRSVEERNSVNVKPGYEKTWREFFFMSSKNYDLKTINSARLLSETNIGLRRIDASDLDVVRANIVAIYAKNIEAGNSYKRHSQNRETKQTVTLADTISPLKLLNPFKALNAISVGLRFGLSVLVDTVLPTTATNSDGRKSTIGTAAFKSNFFARNIKKVVTYPFAALEAVISPLSKFEYTPTGGRLLETLKSTWSNMFPGKKNEYRELPKNEEPKNASKADATYTNGSMTNIAKGMGREGSKELLQSILTSSAATVSVSPPSPSDIRPQTSAPVVEVDNKNKETVTSGQEKSEPTRGRSKTF